MKAKKPASAYAPTDIVTIARIAAGERASEAGATSLVVQALCTDGEADYYQVFAPGGCLEDGEAVKEFRTCKAAMRYASEMALTLIYDDCMEVEQ